MPEAEKALGFKINLETVNGNDLQPRITAAIQSGAGPDLIMLFNNQPQLYAESLVDMSDVAEAIGKARGRLLSPRQVELQRRQEVDLHAVDHRRRHDRLPQVVVRRGRRRPSSPTPGRSIARSARSSRPRAGRSARRSATPSATRRRSPIPTCGRGAARKSRHDGKTVVINTQGDDRLRQVHDRASGRTRTTRAASPGTTPTTTARSCRRPSPPR